MSARYACARCSGTGRLPHHTNVLGGVCFKCHGAGTQPNKPTNASAKWAVFGLEVATGAWGRTYNVSGRTAAETIKKAREIFAKSSAEWRNRWNMAAPRAIQHADMADVTACEWDAAAKATETN